MKPDALMCFKRHFHLSGLIFKTQSHFACRELLIYLIQMTGEIEVHEPLHSYNAEHVSEQYLRTVQKIVYSDNKDFY